MKGKTLKQLMDLSKRKKQKIKKLEAEMKSEKAAVAKIDKAIPAARKAEAAQKTKKAPAKKKPAAKKKTAKKRPAARKKK